VRPSAARSGTAKGSSIGRQQRWQRLDVAHVRQSALSGRVATSGAVITATGPKRPKPYAARILKQSKGRWLSRLRLNQFYYPKDNTTSYLARQPSPPKSNQRKRYANANKASSRMCRFANRASTPVTQRDLANIGKFLGEHRGLQLNYHSYHVQVHT
jgi:hypothetical protein